MGDFNVRIAKTKEQSQVFMRHLLQDVEAFKYMLENKLFEDDIIRIGAEQELCIVDVNCKPAHKNIELLELINNDDVVTELAKFNIELNLEPKTLTGDCFRSLENEILEKLDLVKQSSVQLNLQPVLAGILPTIRKGDVAMKNITPLARYRLLLDVLKKLRGSKVELKIGGTDELNIKHDSALTEACNTSFQVHLQIKPDEFVDKYNFAQILAAPLMAICTNSPLLFGKRLWHETRIALFQQSLDTRDSLEHLREKSPRVIFGNEWLKESITELYKEDIARYKILLNTDIEESSLDTLKNGNIPSLRALNIHNGTVYRWMRPCYGISPNGKPHLRIENRIIPAGPTVLDEVANAAFWIGAMAGFEGNMKDVISHFSFADAKNNFFAACRYGIDSYFYWLDGEKLAATDVLRNKLIPIAKNGLRKMKVDEQDVERYIGVIEQRIDAKKTGSQWQLNSFNALIKECGREEAVAIITSKMIEKQASNEPVHDWELANKTDIKNWAPQSLKVEEFMTTDLFTAQPDDIVEFVADILDWRKIRHLPIEDKKGKLIGMVSSRKLLNYYKNAVKNGEQINATVKEVMVKDPVTISPYNSIIDAIELMEKHKIGSLPVVKRGKLVGIVTEMDFLRLSTRLLRRLSEEQ